MLQASIGHKYTIKRAYILIFLKSVILFIVPMLMVQIRSIAVLNDEGKHYRQVFIINLQLEESTFAMWNIVYHHFLSHDS